MNIQAVNSQNFQSKLPKSRINVVGKVNGYVEQMLAEGNAKLENYAKMCNTTVKIAQKENSILVNAGPRTSSFNLNNLKHGSEFYENIIANIKENGNILCNYLK